MTCNLRPPVLLCPPMFVMGRQRWVRAINCHLIFGNELYFAGLFFRREMRIYRRKSPAPPPIPTLARVLCFTRRCAQSLALSRAPSLARMLAVSLSQCVCVWVLCLCLSVSLAVFAGWGWDEERQRRGGGEGRRQASFIFTNLSSLVRTCVRVCVCFSLSLSLLRTCRLPSCWAMIP